MTEQRNARLRIAAFLAAFPLLFGGAALAGAAIEPHGEDPTARNAEQEEDHMSANTAHTPDPVRGLAVAQDDLQVVRFHSKERDGRGTYRWTRALSYLSLTAVPADTQALVLWMDNGGRPAQAPAAEVEAFIGDVSLGKVVVGSGMQPYVLGVPAEVAHAAAASQDAVTVRLRTVTWSPRATLGVSDQRQLGVMVDRVELRRAP